MVACQTFFACQDQQSPDKPVIPTADYFVGDDGEIFIRLLFPEQMSLSSQPWIGSDLFNSGWRSCVGGAWQSYTRVQLYDSSVGKVPGNINYRYDGSAGKFVTASGYHCPSFTLDNIPPYGQ